MRPWGALFQLMKDRTFLRIFMMFLVFYIAASVVLVHLVNYATDTGISVLAAAAMVSVMGIANTIGRLGMGAISDRIGNRNDVVACCICVTVSLLLFTLRKPLFMWAAVALFGVGYGGTSPLIPAVAGEQFGARRLATVTGAILAGTYVGFAIGPYMGGVLFDMWGSYFWPFAISSGLTVLATIVAARLPDALPETADKAQAAMPEDRGESATQIE